MLYPARAHAFFRLMNDEDACLDVRHVSTVLYGAEHAESALQPNAELDVEAAKAVVGAHREPPVNVLLVRRGHLARAICCWRRQARSRWRSCAHRGGSAAARYRGLRP